MKKFTKEQKKVIDEMYFKIFKKGYEVGYLEGSNNVFEYFLEATIDSIEREYKGFSNLSIIRLCNKEIKKINEMLVELRGKNEG